MAATTQLGETDTKLIRHQLVALSLRACNYINLLAPSFYLVRTFARPANNVAPTQVKVDLKTHFRASLKEPLNSRVRLLLLNG